MILYRDDYDLLKQYFAATKGRYFLQRPTNLNRIVIEKAHDAGDKDLVIDAYLDILDYNKELKDADQDFFNKVLESMSYEEAIDHVLFGHIKEQMDQRGFDCRQYAAVYYLHAKGGLTAADLMKDLASDSGVEKIANSQLFKTEFVDKIMPSEEEENQLGLDAYVLEQV